MKIILRVSVQQSRWMIKLVPYVNWDVREKTSCCDIIETNNVNKSLKRRDAVPQREGYTPPSPPPISLYPYRAYIETLLSYGPAAKESQLTGVMWYKDTPGHQDKTAAANKGFTSRKTLTINVVLYAEFDNVIEIDRNRQVLLDYSA
jgi:hypothetical protein